MLMRVAGQLWVQREHWVQADFCLGAGSRAARGGGERAFAGDGMWEEWPGALQSEWGVARALSLLKRIKSTVLARSWVIVFSWVGTVQSSAACSRRFPGCCVFCAMCCGRAVRALNFRERVHTVPSARVLGVGLCALGRLGSVGLVCLHERLSQRIGHLNSNSTVGLYGQDVVRMANPRSCVAQAAPVFSPEAQAHMSQSYLETSSLTHRLFSHHRSSKTAARPDHLQGKHASCIDLNPCWWWHVRIG